MLSTWDLLWKVALVLAAGIGMLEFFRRIER